MHTSADVADLPATSASPAVNPAPPALPLAAPAFPRLVSLDAYRGFVMLLMGSEVMNVPRVARLFKDSAARRFVAYHFDHVPWTGGGLWDMIQPSFMFIVGVALPFSLAARRRRGHSFARMLPRTLGRSLLLILLAVFLSSTEAPRTNFIFTNVLAQIGLAYPFLFLLAWLRPRWQMAAAGLLLSAHWLAFALYPAAPAGFDYTTVGVPADWPYHLQGFAAHWDKSANLGHAFDRWFLNLFPRDKPWTFSPGGYATLNFVTSLATMTFGLLAGGLLRGPVPAARKCPTLLAAGLLALLAGLALDHFGVCPIVKRLWTPAWVLYSAGWTLPLLAGFYAVIDAAGFRRWAFPLVVVGMNSLAMYCMASHPFHSFVVRGLETHVGPSTFEAAGAAYAPLLEGAGVLLVFWFICFWMYRRKIFLRL